MFKKIALSTFILLTFIISWCINFDDEYIVNHFAFGMIGFAIIIVIAAIFYSDDKTFENIFS